MPNSKTHARPVKNAPEAKDAVIALTVAPVVMAKAVATVVRVVTAAAVVIAVRVATVAVTAVEIVRPVVTVDQAAMAAVVRPSRMTTTAPPPNSPPPSSRATATKHQVLERTNERGCRKVAPFFVYPNCGQILLAHHFEPTH